MAREISMLDKRVRSKAEYFKKTREGVDGPLIRTQPRSRRIAAEADAQRMAEAAHLSAVQQV